MVTLKLQEGKTESTVSYFSDVSVAKESCVATSRLSTVGDHARTGSQGGVIHQGRQGCNRPQVGRCPTVTVEGMVPAVIVLETRFLKSRRAAARALNLAGLGAGRTGLELDEVNPVFTFQVTSSTVGNHVKSVCKVDRKINQHF